MEKRAHVAATRVLKEPATARVGVRPIGQVVPDPVDAKRQRGRRPRLSTVGCRAAVRRLNDEGRAERPRTIQFCNGPDGPDAPESRGAEAKARCHRGRKEAEGTRRGGRPRAAWGRGAQGNRARKFPSPTPRGERDVRPVATIATSIFCATAGGARRSANRRDEDGASRGRGAERAGQEEEARGPDSAHVPPPTGAKLHY